MARRKGMAKGKGRGYKNLPNFPKDPKVHSDSARGRKQPQKIPNLTQRQIRKTAEAQLYPYLIDTQTGKKVKRIKFGDEEGVLWEKGRKCPDCGVKQGQYHWFECDIEISPIKEDYNGQLLSSDLAGNYSK